MRCDSHSVEASLARGWREAESPGLVNRHNPLRVGSLSVLRLVDARRLRRCPEEEEATEGVVSGDTETLPGILPCTGRGSPAFGTVGGRVTKRQKARRAISSLGGEQAEADPLLSMSFYAVPFYRSVVSKDDPRCFLIGRTGSGKSAALQRMEEEHTGHTIRIAPEDLSLPYITELGAVRVLTNLGVHLDPLFIALWKHVLLVEIIKHRYGVNTPAAKQRFLDLLRERLQRDRTKSAALEYLDEFEGRFWCETHERVREITHKFEEQIQSEAGAAVKLSELLDVGGAGSESATMAAKERRELADRFQRVVNETQLPRLNQMIGILDQEILDSDVHFTFIVIDDLDRDWVDERIANDLLRCLFRAIVDLKRVARLKVVVALRTNIFEQLNFGGRTGGQEEKFRSLSMPVRWSRADLKGMLDERCRVVGEQAGVLGLSEVKDLLPRTNQKRGSALDYLLERTLMRPRDAIAFINECLVLGQTKSRLSWNDIRAAEEAYSYKRLLALRDEWKPTYPGIDRVFEKFERAPLHMSAQELTRILDEIVLLPSSASFEGIAWMTRVSEPVWSGIGVRDWSEIYQPLVRLLFRIGFLGVCESQASAPVFSVDKPEFAERSGNLQQAASFVVHSAFRVTLDIAEGD